MKLSEICEYTTKRIETESLGVDNYISTENMLQNKGGVVAAAKVPAEKAVAFNPGDILISNIRPYFKKIWHADKRGGCSSDVLCLRALSGIDKTYLYYLLSQDSFFEYVMSGAKGSKMPRCDKAQIMNWEVSIPDFAEQKRVGEFLKNIDEKIALNNRINHNLEEQSQALYKSWFVDFKPFKDGKFVDSEMGMVPEGWRVGTLSELVEVRYGKDHKMLNDGRIPVYGSGGIMRHADRALFESESVLIPRKGTLNNVMFVCHPFWTVDTMFYTIGKTEHVIKYAHLFMLTQDLSSMNAGSAVPSMTTDILNKLPVLIPSQEVLRSFDAIVSAAYSLIERSQVENSLLASTRDFILPQLMSGDIVINSLTC